MTTETAALEAKLQEVDGSIDDLASKGEFELLASHLAPDFRYNHSTGATQDKKEWLEGLKPLVGRRNRITTGIRVEVHGDLGVAMGDLDIIWGDGRHNYDRYVRVYRLQGDKWLAVSQRTVPAHDRAPSAS
jgi:hypothetical protein